MENRQSSIQWQDFAVFGIRWVLIIAAGLVVFLARSEAGSVTSYTDFILTFAVAGVANLVLLIPMVIRSLRRVAPYLLLPVDLVIAITLTLLADNNMLVLVGVVSVLTVSGFLRLGWMLGLLQTVLVISGVGGILFSTVPNFNREISTYTPAAIIALSMLFSGAIWVYFRDSDQNRHRRSLEDLRREKDEEIADVRDNLKGFVEMATMLNSTLSYERILDAALGIGRLCLRDNGKRIASAVFLYDSDGDALEVVNQRGLGHVDEMKRLRGESGIVGAALNEGHPIISGSSSNDPELRDFIAFGGSLSTLVIPLRAGYDNFGILVYAADSENAFNPDKIEALNAIGTLATIALQNAVLYRNLIEEKDRIIEMEENGRKSLVRDLHDIPTQTISAITMRVRIILRLLENQRINELKDELQNVEDMAQRATEEIRHVLFKLRPLVLESQGFAAALESLAEKNQKTYGQAVAVRVQPEVEKILDQQAQGALFYLVEEAVSNARKYAQARQVSVTVGRKGDLLIARIQDNGVGFDVARVNGSSGGSSYGMTNMRERAQLLNGTIEIDSAPGKGTVINVLIPIDERFGSAETRRSIKVPIPESKLSQAALNRVTRQIRR